MKCSEIQNLIGIYWDLPADDFRRINVDEHMKRCSSCAEEFDMWQESTNLIQFSGSHIEVPIFQSRVSKSVMDRIYSDDAWRIPVPERVYSMTYKTRRNISAIIAFCLALFLVSFLYSVFYQNSNLKSDPVNYKVAGLTNADDLGDSHAVLSKSSVVEGVAVASISDPFVLKMGIHPYNPDYLLVLSILGLICALLVMNWLSRIRM